MSTPPAPGMTMQYRIQTIDQLKPLLQGFRRKAGLTQAAMAERLGVSQQNYAQLESNVSSASVERLFKVLLLLNVQLIFDEREGRSENKEELSVQSLRKPRITPPLTRDGKSQRPGKSAPLSPLKATTAKRPTSLRQTTQAPTKLTKRNDTTKW